MLKQLNEPNSILNNKVHYQTSLNKTIISRKVTMVSTMHGKNQQPIVTNHMADISEDQMLDDEEDSMEEEDDDYIMKQEDESDFLKMKRTDDDFIKDDFLMKHRGVASPIENNYWMSNSVGGTPLGDCQSESGFISSQPSMSEFILPHHLNNDMVVPNSPHFTSLHDTNVLQATAGNQQNLQEYPWMKEKKTSRKNSAQQGRESTLPISFFTPPFCIPK